LTFTSRRGQHDLDPLAAAAWRKLVRLGQREGRVSCFSAAADAAALFAELPGTLREPPWPGSMTIVPRSV
jgi:hypothetical protein